MIRLNDVTKRYGSTLGVDHLRSPHVVKTTHQTGSYGRLVQYEIKVEGHLGTRWSAWFDGLSITSEDDGTTVLRGSVVDQAALHGLLQKLRDVGIPLLSLTPLETPTTSGTTPHDETNGR